MAQSPIVNYDAVVGNLKTVYAGYENTIPKEYICMREFKFEAGSKVGDEYQYGVELTRPQGHTTAGPGVFPELNAPVARQAPKAKLQPYQHYLRERITYDVLSRAAESAQAAKAELGATVESMRDSMMFRQECYALYGQMGLATIGTVTGDVLTFSAAEWASGMWAGQENVPLTIRDANGVFVKDVTVLTIDDTARTLTLNPGDGVGLAATNVVWFQGGSSTSEPVGMAKIIQNTGTLYNISAATYGLWKGNHTVAAANTDIGFKLAMTLDAQIRSRGGIGDNLALIAPVSWNTIVGSIEAARDFGGEQYKNTEIDRGTRQVKFFSPTGTTTLMCHPIVKPADYFSVRKGKWFRAGATDPTFEIPGGEGKVLYDLQDYPGKELRSMANSTWFSPRPAASGMITGLTPGGTVST